MATINGSLHLQIRHNLSGLYLADWKWLHPIVILATKFGFVPDCSSVYSGAGQRKHQSSVSLAFVGGIHWWPVNFPKKGPEMWKRFPFDDVIMLWKSLICVVISTILVSIYKIIRKLEQLECLHSENTSAAPWLPILLIHIGSWVKRR